MTESKGFTPPSRPSTPTPAVFSDEHMATRDYGEMASRYESEGNVFLAAVALLAAGAPPRVAQVMLDKRGSCWDCSDVIEEIASRYLEGGDCRHG